MVPVHFGTLAEDAAGKSIETGLSPQTRRLFRRQQFRSLLKAKRFLSERQLFVFRLQNDSMRTVAPNHTFKKLALFSHISSYYATTEEFTLSKVFA